MKKFLIAGLLLGSTITLAACTAQGDSAADMNGAMYNAPYSEERTVGASGSAPVRSAEPVFENKQMK